MTTFRYFLGWIFSIMLPAKTMVLYNSFTIPQGWDDSPFVDKLIRFYLTIRAKQEEQEAPGKLEEIHRNFWAKTDSYFADTENRTEEVFIPAYGDIVREMVPLLAANLARGMGNGWIIWRESGRPFPSSLAST